MNTKQHLRQLGILKMSGYTRTIQMNVLPQFQGDGSRVYLKQNERGLRFVHRHSPECGAVDVRWITPAEGVRLLRWLGRQTEKTPERTTSDGCAACRTWVATLASLLHPIL